MYKTNVTGYWPEAYITVRKNRLKLYNDRNYYLKHDSTFEIELFNSTGTSVLAKIWINGEMISPTGIVVPAYDRVYLERFIDTPEKLKFTVFKVDDVKETEDARNRNGVVRIEFYSKYETPSYNTWELRPEIYQPVITYTDVPNYQPFINTITSTDTLTASNANVSFTSSNGANLVYGNSGTLTFNTLTEHVPEVETGRVSKGKTSKQIFTKTSERFSDYPYRTIEYQLLPESLKQVNIKETRVYCSNCGHRARKSSWKYCPICGHEI